MIWRLILGKNNGGAGHVETHSLDEMLKLCHGFRCEDGDRLAYLVDRIEGNVVIGYLAKGESAL